MENIENISINGFGTILPLDFDKDYTVSSSSYVIPKDSWNKWSDMVHPKIYSTEIQPPGYDAIQGFVVNAKNEFEESIRESASKRALDCISDIYNQVNDGQLDIKTGYIAVKFLTETIAPFVNVETVETFSKIVKGWEEKVKLLEQEEAKLKANTVLVKDFKVSEEGEW